MRLLSGLTAAFGACLTVLGFCGFSGPVTRSLDVPVIVTAAPVYEPGAALRGSERFPGGAQLLLVKAGHAQPLVNGFAATADASVSFDGARVLFSGKKNDGDPWSLWELRLSDHSVRNVIAGDTDVVRPLYLPEDRLLYARHAAHGFQLEAAKLDGSEILPLSHIHASAMPLDVLADGRILFESTYPLGEGSTPEMYLVYSDGSGVESYRCDHGSPRWGGKQMASGDVAFTHGATLARFTSPLATEAAIAAPKAEYAGGIVEAPSGDWLLSARTTPGEHYALQVWKPGAPQLRPFFSQSGEDLVQPVLLKERERPHYHPSALHDWKYANLLALDARESREGDLKASPAAVRLEQLDPAGKPVVLGTAPVEPDGSFFVKAPADRPIRFALLDTNGKVLREEHGWFWIRKGEQRICVGCHTGPERASENRVPAVLLRTTTAVDLTGSDLTGTQQHAAAGSH